MAGVRGGNVGASMRRHRISFREPLANDQERSQLQSAGDRESRCGERFGRQRGILGGESLRNLADLGSIAARSDSESRRLWMGLAHRDWEIS